MGKPAAAEALRFAKPEERGAEIGKRFGLGSERKGGRWEIRSAVAEGGNSDRRKRFRFFWVSRGKRFGSQNCPS